tara:strand:- start:72732 stop:73010 length:279 start_codon:yes stop_codon:yes gene_type:complete
MTWGQKANAIIWDLHNRIPSDATFKERKKAVQSAYPWGTRSGWPYKAWLREQRIYLARYADKQETAAKLPPTPLERMIAKANRRDEKGLQNV